MERISAVANKSSFNIFQWYTARLALMNAFNYFKWLQKKNSLLTKMKKQRNEAKNSYKWLVFKIRLNFNDFIKICFHFLFIECAYTRITNTKHTLVVAFFSFPNSHYTHTHTNQTQTKRKETICLKWQLFFPFLAST